ncbi:hypothetical protein GAYE_PCTG60G1379 [Galdieria yellowstonensis]|uniref:Thioredoxin domain-containing protein n=1 Tax=Galdieria yellowstonensis TaxID=3028027 RepID=A0AAV9I6P8_9RHOD|nr:hypothetical protein GAYE_PCTG60G1379 [Galdieria yellowstonensis]
MFRWTSLVVLIGSCFTIWWSGKNSVQQPFKQAFKTNARPFYCEQLHSIPGFQSVYADWKEWSKLVEAGNISSGPLIVLFYLPTCPFSRELWPKVEGLAQAFPGACVVTIRTSWEAPRLKDHVVFSFPNLFISKDGHHFHRYRGERDWEHLLNATEHLLERKAMMKNVQVPTTLPEELFSVDSYWQYMKLSFIFIIWLYALISKWPYFGTAASQNPNNNPLYQYLL